MSYNIDTFKVKKLENLKVPVASFFKHERSDWHPDKVINDDNSVTFNSLESEWTGRIIEDDFYFDEIKCSGEGSGTTMLWILEPSLEDSTGILIATCVWEGGDSINKLSVENGVVTWADIEI